MTNLSLGLALAVAFVLGQTLFGVVVFPLTKRALARGNRTARLWGYAGGMASDTIPVLCVAALWISADRPWAELGLTLPQGGLGWVTTAIAFALTAVYVAQNLRSARDPQALIKLAEQFAALEDLMPHDAREQRAWTLFSLVAGVCEELIYRGFAVALLAASLGTWGALVLSSVAFGLIHTYQGRAGMLRTGVMGLVFGAMYALSGSLLAPVVFHAVGNIATGVVGRAAFTRKAPVRAKAA